MPTRRNGSSPSSEASGNPPAQQARTRSLCAVTFRKDRWLNTRCRARTWRRSRSGRARRVCRIRRSISRACCTSTRPVVSTRSKRRLPFYRSTLGPPFSEVAYRGWRPARIRERQAFSGRDAFRHYPAALVRGRPSPRVPQYAPARCQRLFGQCACARKAIGLPSRCSGATPTSVI